MEKALSRTGLELLLIIATIMVEILIKEVELKTKEATRNSNILSISLLGSVRARRILEISVLDFVLSMEGESRDGSSL